MDDVGLIRATVLDYFEGWFDGDPERMRRALHTGLAKRSLAEDGAGLDHLTSETMVSATARGVGKREDPQERRLDIDVVDRHGDIATVVVDSAVYREYLHLVRTGDGWKIANALWTRASGKKES